MLWEYEEFLSLFGKIVSEIDDGEKLLIYGDLWSQQMNLLVKIKTKTKPTLTC